MFQPEPPPNDFLLPFIQNVEVPVDLALLHFELDPVHDIVRFRTQDIDKRNLVAFFIRSDRVVEGNVFASLL
ncbi:hypothetical protein D3C79_1041980 [compost metagenome]